MRLLETIPRLRLAMLLGATTGLGAAGCVVTRGDGSDRTECGSILSHPEEQDDGTCVCDANYDWCNPNDEDDYSCCENNDNACENGSNNYVNGDECFCDAGYTFCSDDPNDYDCCPGGGETGDTTAETTGDGDGDGDGDTGTDGTLPPETCETSEEGFVWCTNSDTTGPEGSQTFVCESGAWVEYPNFPDQSCVDDGYDFAYGCVDNGTDVQFVCGDGPGTSCDTSGYEAMCIDSDVISECFYGKTTETSCQAFCENIGIDGITYEIGECETVEGASDCSCYDP